MAIALHVVHFRVIMDFFSDNEVSFDELGEEDVPMDEDSVADNQSDDDIEKAQSLSSRISVVSSGFGFNDNEGEKEEEN